MSAHSDPLAPLGAEAALGQQAEELAVGHEPDLSADLGDGSAVLDALVEFMTRFVVFANAAQPVVLALFIIHTYTFEMADQTPFLHIKSPEKRCGKSRALEVLALFVREPWPVVQPTEATLYRVIDARRPTMLLDEVDTLLKVHRGDEAAERVRGLINAGNRRTSTVPRCVGSQHEVIDFNIFCPKVLAGIGELPDTIADRAVTIELRRKAPGELAERFRVRCAEAEAQPLREAAEAWALQLGRLLEDASPELPGALSDRQQDAWEPLLAIADLAGGDWPERARAAALEISGRQESDNDSLGIRLLADCHQSFHPDAHGGPITAMHTADLLAELTELEVAPWGVYLGRRMTSRDLAKLLRPFGIHSESVWTYGSTKKGYRRDDFVEAWSRYTPALYRPVPTSGSGASGPSGDPPSESQGVTKVRGLMPSDLRTCPPDPPDPERGGGDERLPFDPIPPTDGAPEAGGRPSLAQCPRCLVCGTPCRPTRDDGVPIHPNCGPGAYLEGEASMAVDVLDRAVALVQSIGTETTARTDA